MDFLDEIFGEVGFKIKLDENQKEVVLDNSDYLMVIAGAGSGKTLTIVAKVIYLITKCNIKAEDILIISFTNKAVDEIKERLSKYLYYLPVVSTFHKLGYSILKNEGENLEILKNPYQVITNYFSHLKSKSKYSDFIKVLSFYFSDSKCNLKSIEGKCEDFVFYEELLIANYLYLNNIDYDYVIEKNFTYIKIKDLGYSYLIFYIPDSKSKLLKIYRGYQIHHIKRRFNDYKYDIIVGDKDSVLDILEDFLLKNNFNIKINIKSLVNNFGVNKFMMLCYDFIKMFKIKGYGENYFKFLMSKCNDNKYMVNFLTLIQDLYRYYQKYMYENNYIDFEDMINRAVEKVKEGKIDEGFKYIIIDEFQDISLNRLELIKAMYKIMNCKIVVVGDDFQAIFGFAGSTVNSFLSFKEVFQDTRVLKIIKTYRNSQELIDIAGKFIMKDEKHIKKNLISNKKMERPLKIVFYKKDFARIVHEIIEKIILGFGDASILLLGRYNFDKNRVLNNSYFFEENGNIKSKIYPNANIHFLTIHKAKGLGFDNVIILNNDDDILGFPSKIKNSKLMNLLENEHFLDNDLEERRLFYVALTRTKNYVYLLVPKNKESKFIKELIEENFEKLV